MAIEYAGVTVPQRCMTDEGRSQDLTDTFADVQDDTATSSGQGHPRGSSMISGLTSSRRSTPSNAVSSAFGSPSKPLPNFSALLSFLDADTDHGHVGRVVRPKPLSPTVNGAQTSPAPSSATRDRARAEVHLSATPRSQPHSPVVETASPKADRTSPSPLLEPRHRQSVRIFTPSHPTATGTSAADRMAAALMEGAPPPRWDSSGARPPATSTLR